jgi:uncharacterized OB-fold protein
MNEATEIDCGFRAGLARGVVLVAVCEACGTILDYSRRRCTRCSGDRIGWRESSGRGVLRAAIAVQEPGAAPGQWRTIASVALAEGPHLLALYAGARDEAAGTEVEAVITNGDLRFQPAR